MVADEILVFVVVFAAILVAYALGTRSKTSGNYVTVPRVSVWLEYRDEVGRTTGRSLTITKTLVRNDGRAYLCGSDGSKRNFKMFRTDRIISVATLDGEVMDKNKFLKERCGFAA